MFMPGISMVVSTCQRRPASAARAGAGATPARAVEARENDRATRKLRIEHSFPKRPRERGHDLGRAQIYAEAACGERPSGTVARTREDDEEVPMRASDPKASGGGEQPRGCFRARGRGRRDARRL